MLDNQLISVIDDDESLRMALVSLLKSLGYRTSAHVSAEAFLKTKEADSADCIISDIQMGEMSGIDLQHELVRLGSETPVILITARNEKALHERARASGASCLLLKPFDAQHLIDCLARVLLPQS